MCYYYHYYYCWDYEDARFTCCWLLNWSAPATKPLMLPLSQPASSLFFLVTSHSLYHLTLLKVLSLVSFEVPEEAYWQNVGILPVWCVTITTSIVGTTIEAHEEVAEVKIFEREWQYIDTGFQIIYDKSIRMADKVGSNVTKPHTTWRQMHCSNASADDPCEYYKGNLWIGAAALQVIHSCNLTSRAGAICPCF